MKHQDENLMNRIEWAARAVHKQLGPGFEREVYINALVAEIQRLGLLYERDKKYPIIYHGVTVGDFTADILVEGRLLVQVGSGPGLDESDVIGMGSRLIHARLTEGLLIGFGSITIELARYRERQQTTMPA